PRRSSELGFTQFPPTSPRRAASLAPARQAGFEPDPFPRPTLFRISIPADTARLDAPAVNSFQDVVQPVQVGDLDPVLLAGQESGIFLFLIRRKIVTGDVVDGKILRFYPGLYRSVIQLFLQRFNGNFVFVV